MPRTSVTGCARLGGLFRPAPHLPLPRALGLVLAIVLLTSLLWPAASQAAPASSPTVSVNRITNSGTLKWGIQISRDGSRVAWIEEAPIPEQPGYNYTIVKAAATDGSWVKEILRQGVSRPATSVRGPRYRADDLNYQVTLGAQKIRFSADGSTMVLQMLENYSGGYDEGFGIVDVASGSIRFIPLKVPSGMGVPAGNYTVNLDRMGWDLTGDGTKLVYTIEATGEGDYSGAEAVVVYDIASGQASRLAGYTAKDPNTRVVSVAGHPYAIGRSIVDGAYAAFVAYRIPDVGSAYYTVPLGGGTPALMAPELIGCNYQLVDSGKYFFAREGYNSAAFFPSAGGEKIEFQDPDGWFDNAFWDDQPGILLHPVWATGVQEVSLSRRDGITVLLKPGEKGLPASWNFGVPSINSDSDYRFGSSDGRKLLLSLVSPDGKAQDLFLATVAYATTGGAPGSGSTGSAGGAAGGSATGGTTGGSEGSVDLTWNASTSKDAAGQSAYGYYVYRSTIQGVFDDNSPLTDFPLTGTQYKDTGLEAGRTYYYKVVPTYPGGGKGTPVFLSATAQGEMVIWLKINHPIAKVKGQEVSLPLAPFIENGRTLVPLRFIGENLGADIQWEGTERRVTYTKGTKVVVLWVGRKDALVNGQSSVLDVPPTIVNDRTVVPLRFVANALEAKVDWDGVNYEITIRP